MNINEIQIGDIFSEESHYSVKNITKDYIIVIHLESKKEIQLSHNYVKELLKTSDQYDKEVKVGREDKKDGTPGIRTIFDSIHGSQVFTVCFKKQDKPKTLKQLNSEKETQRIVAIDIIDTAKKQKKSMAVAYKKALQYIQDNPINNIIEGEDRILRGYKTQFSSRDGRYNCLDMDINDVRPVNILTIKWLVYNGVKYVVE